MSDSDSTVKKSAWVVAGETTVAEEGSQSYIGIVHYGFGFKAMKKDVDQYKLWFPYNRFVEDGGKGKEAAQAAFKRAIVEHGIELKGNKVETNFCFWMDTSDMLGRNTSQWKVTSMWWPNKLWTPGYKEVIVSSLEKFNIDPGKSEVIAKLEFMDDPSGYMREGALDPNTGRKLPDRPNQIPYISKVYATLQDAMKDAGVSITDDSSSTSSEILEIHRDDPEMTCYAIGAIYSMSAKEVADILGLTGEQVLDEIKNHSDELKQEGGKKVADSYGVKVIEIAKFLK
jgi:hypothetical protein